MWKEECIEDENTQLDLARHISEILISIIPKCCIESCVFRFMISEDVIVVVDWLQSNIVA